MSSDLDTHVNPAGAEPSSDIEQITHDLNNQVMVIQGNASLLRMKTAEWPQIHELAEQILAASQQAAALTKELTAKALRPMGAAG